MRLDQPVPDELEVGKVSSFSVDSVEVDDYLKLVLESADDLRDVDSRLDASCEQVVVEDHEVLVLVGEAFAGQPQPQALHTTASVNPLSSFLLTTRETLTFMTCSGCWSTLHALGTSASFC